MEKFSTSDFCLAITLYIFYPLMELDKSRPRMEFIFERTPDLEDTLEKYHSRNLLVKPVEFYQSSVDLKRKMHN